MGRGQNLSAQIGGADEMDESLGSGQPDAQVAADGKALSQAAGVDHTSLVETWPDMWPKTPRDFWQLLNATVPIEGRVVRLLCSILSLAYIIVTVVRVLGEGPDFLWVRLTVPAYGLVGVILARRFNWWGLRTYACGVVLLLSLTTIYMDSARGYRPDDLALIAMSTFVAFPFLMTLTDLLLTDALLIGGSLFFFCTATQVMSSPGVIWTVIIAALGAGNAVCVVIIAYRSLTYRSLDWWEQSFEREHVLREFAERAASSLTSSDMLDALASRFKKTVPNGGCLILLGQAEEPSLRLAAAAGLGSTPAVASPVFHSLWRKVRGGSEPLTHKQLQPEELRDLQQELRLTYTPRGVAVLPVHGFLPGLIVLLIPDASAVTDDRVGMWQAMASQAGVAAANARAWEELREQEASARRLADERGQLAELRTHFISMTSHEFRTPLAAILAAADNLDHYLARMTPEQRRQRLAKIKREATAMTTLLDDLLLLGRAESKRLPFVPQSLDVEQLCQELATAVRAAEGGTHEIVLRTDNSPNEFIGDPDLLRKIIGNLLTNAVKYSPDGGRVEVEVTSCHENLVLRVRDQGIGIPPENVRDLFQPFHRGANVGKIKGSGLGLAITQKAVEAHGGTITVETAIGAGSTFEVTLPNRQAFRGTGTYGASG